MFSILLATALISFSPKQSLSEPQILSRWATVMERPQNAAHQVSQFFLGGLTDVEPDAFYVSGTSNFVEKRWYHSGSPIWRAELQAPSQGTWALSDELVIGADVKGRLYGIRRDTGEIAWSYQAKGLFFSQPLIHEDRSYWINSYGMLSAHRNSDGAWLWQHSESATTSLHLWSHQGPQLFSNLVLAGFPSGLLMAFEPVTGNRVWQESFGLAIEDSLSLNEVRSIQTKGEYLIASSYSGNVKMWKSVAGSKSLLWEKRMSLQGPASIDLEAQQAYLSDRQGEVHAVDLESGYIKWTQILGTGLGATPSFGDRSVWVATSGGSLHAFDRQTGQILAPAYPIGSAVFNPALVVGDEAIVISSKGVLRRLHLMGIEEIPVTIDQQVSQK